MLVATETAGLDPAPVAVRSWPSRRSREVSEAAGEGQSPTIDLNLIVPRQAELALVGLRGGPERPEAIEPRHVRPAHVPEPVELEEEPEAPALYDVHGCAQGHLRPWHELVLGGVAVQPEALR